MSAIQIVCAVVVPLLWGYQFVAIKVGVTEFPPLFFLALRFLAIALLLVPFVKRPARHQIGPVAAISIFLGGLNFGLFYVGLGLGSGSLSAIAYQLATPFTVLLAWPLLAERPSATTSAGVALAFVGVVVLAAGPGVVSKRAAAAARGWGSLRLRGVQRLDETLRPFRSPDVDGMVVAVHGAAGHGDVAAPRIWATGEPCHGG
ncbi:drug/metabolite transporter (DMT)-like permease [Bradyrhizobium niftali]